MGSVSGKSPRDSPSDEILSSGISRALASVMEFAPFVVEGFVCSAVYSAGLSCAQHVGMKLKVSCACLPSASVLGALSVMCSAAAAGQAGPLARRLLFPDDKILGQQYKTAAARREKQKQKQKPKKEQQKALTVTEQVVCHAALGLVTFKLAGGRFRNLMPSDLCFPGAFFSKSIPARWDGRSPKKFTAPEKVAVAGFLTRDGCHHCGAKPSLDKLILDHIPPTSWVQNLEGPVKLKFGRLFNCSGPNPLTHPSMDIHALIPQGKWGRSVHEQLRVAQRVLPQCKPCSHVQGSAVNNNKRVLVPKRAVSWLLPHAASAAVFTSPVQEKLVENGVHVWLLPQRWRAFENKLKRN